MTLPDTSEILARALARALESLPSGHRLKEAAASGDNADQRLFWLESCPRQFPLTPSTPPGRYRIEYWTVGDGCLTGVEIGTASPLILSPPGSGPYIVLIRRLA
ncbi:MAG: hypothetical protein Q8O15_06000 [Rectinemataceae bacterium]|nr:hypothetical protein [Rectinemataceae bacterium]